MPIPIRGRRPAHWPPRPERAVTAPPARPSRMNPAWPVAAVLGTVLVFAAFLARTTPPMALIMTLAIALAAGTILTLVSGTAWIIRLRRLFADSRH